MNAIKKAAQWVWSKIVIIFGGGGPGEEGKPK